MSTPTLTTPLRYDSPNDAAMRLGNTIVFFEGSPVIVGDVYPDNQADITDILFGPASRKKVHTSDTRLSIDNVPIGWVNLDRGCVFLFRQPSNSQKQGIHLRNQGVFSPSLGKTSFGYSWEEYSDLAPIARSLLRQYPSFEQALKHCTKKPKSKVTSLAFSNEWAMVSRGAYVGLYHKTVPVALLHPEKKTVLFKKGSLTKTRWRSLQTFLPNYGVDYVFTES